MIDLRSMIISLSNQRCSQDEYKQKKRVREHNRAIKKLLVLNRTMYAQEGHCETVVRELLQHPSEKVQLTTAAYCLRAGILNQEAREVLSNIEENSCDKMIALDACLTAMVTVPCLFPSSVNKDADDSGQ